MIANTALLAAALLAKVLLAIEPFTAVGGTLVGASVLALLFGGGKKKKKKKKADEPTSHCPPLPWLNPEVVSSLVTQGIGEGVKGLMPFVSYVARHLYPTRADGSPIPWPTKTPFVLPADFDGALVCRWEELRDMITELEIPLEVDPKPGDVISDLIKTYPLPGYFYQIKNGDTLESIVRSALNSAAAGVGQSSKKRLAYIKQCINKSAKWNLKLYGSSASSKAFPSYYLTDGQGMLAAFLPRHQRAMPAILAGHYPKRAITPSGGKIAGLSENAWALLWLPPLDEDSLQKFGEPICAAGTWSDGSPMTDPPPQLLSLLKEAA